MKRKLLLTMFVVLAMISGILQVFGQTVTTAGTQILNASSASYSDDSGNQYNAISNTVTITVVPIAGVTVTPDETTPSGTIGPLETVDRVFKVCNTGNATNTFILTAQRISPPAQITALYWDVNGDGLLDGGDTQISLNTTQSPSVLANECINVIARIDSGAATAQTEITINITAQTFAANTVNGRPTDDGQIINTVRRGPEFTDPRNPANPPVKLAGPDAAGAYPDGKVRYITNAGGRYTYALAFKNTGGSDAVNVTMMDTLPAGVIYQAGTLKMNNASLTDAADADAGTVNGQILKVTLATVKIDEQVLVTFDAKLDATFVAGAGVINNYTITANNLPRPAISNDQLVIVNPVGVVFAGRSNGSITVTGANVVMSSDAAGTQVVTLPNTNGTTPNPNNANAFVTSVGGGWNFTLDPSQLGAPNLPAKYYVMVSATGYNNRLLEIMIAPAASGLPGLYDATIRPADGKQLAVAGGYLLTQDAVELKNMAILTFNIPLFEPNTLEITKIVDKSFAQIGDIVAYQISVRNTTSVAMADVKITDTLPASFLVAANTFQMQRAGTVTSISPLVQGRNIQFDLPSLAPQETVNFLFRVRVAPNAHAGQQVNLAIAEGKFPSGEMINVGPAQATTTINPGIFSYQQAVVGRVFEDLDADGFFTEGYDRAVSGARIYTSRGDVIITDTAGLYNIPGLDPGDLTLSLDPATIPTGAKLHDEGQQSGNSWTRNIRHPLIGGTLVRINFPLLPKNWNLADAKKSLPTDRSGKGVDCNENCGPEELRLKKRQQIRDHVRAVADANSDREKASWSEQAAFEFVAPEQKSALTDQQILFAGYKDGDLFRNAVEIRTSLNNKVRLFLNDELVPETNIGTTKNDNKVGFNGFTFNALNLKPGPNRFKAVVTNATGKESTAEITLYGRGEARKLVIEGDRLAIKSGGRDAARFVAILLDEWGHPALDTDVVVTASAGRLLMADEDINTVRNTPIPGDGSQNGRGFNTNQVMELEREFMRQSEMGAIVFRLISPPQAGNVTLLAKTTNFRSVPVDIKVQPETRPQILVANATVGYGNAMAEIAQPNDLNKNTFGRANIFFKGNIGEKNVLAFSYDTSRALNQLANRNNLFEQAPGQLGQMYTVFGDSSTRFKEAQSSKKLYAKLERGQNYALFGDFMLNSNEVGQFWGVSTASPTEAQLSAYSRRLTGAKVHGEANGVSVTLSGSRPDTMFARDIFPGGQFGFAQLSFMDLMFGSEYVRIETRDRRNPDVILKTENLVRGIDYNIDYLTGTVFFLRSLNAFDSILNLNQAVITYEYRRGGNGSNVYAGRTQYAFKGVNVGATYVNQQQVGYGPYHMGGVDLHKSFGNNGQLDVEWSRTRGQVMAAGNFFGNASGRRDGDAWRLEYRQPFKFMNSEFYLLGLKSDEMYFNPYGATVTPGSQRILGEYALQFTKTSRLRLAYMDERNETVNVDNSRRTMTAELTQKVNDKLAFTIGYDYRKLDSGTSQADSQMMTAGVEVKPTDKLDFSIRREQNIAGSDPTYPNQWVIGSHYKLNDRFKAFFTQRIGSAPITPLADTASTGFGFTTGNKETAFGIESTLGKFTTLNTRYQIENGINGTDNFAVIGLVNRIPVNKKLSVDVGVERGFQISGPNQDFTSGSLGISWMPNKDFKSSVRYELRDRMGLGHILTAGVAGKMNANWTSLGRVQWSKSEFNGFKNDMMSGRFDMAYRPVDSDRFNWLTSYDFTQFKRGGLGQINGFSFGLGEESVHQISSDALFQPFYKTGENLARNRVEVYARGAFRHVNSSGPSLLAVGTDTYMSQVRVTQRFGRYFDWAIEGRMLGSNFTAWQPAYGAEMGFWVMPDLRVGGGYNFTKLDDRWGWSGQTRKGFYVVVSSKMSYLFDFFGTSRENLQKLDK